MTAKACIRCKATKPLESFYSNGRGRRRSACIACERKFPDRDADILRAVAMWRSGIGTRHIAKAFGISQSTAIRRLRMAGCDTSTRGNGDFCRSGDPLANVPVGSLPPDHPLAEVDRQILASRNARHPYEHGSRASSLALL